MIEILYKITVYCRLVDEDISEEALLSIVVLIAPTLPPIEIYQLTVVSAHTSKLKYLIYKTIIILTT